ncbi:MAG: hydroxymethylbilane synthase [Pseudomonadota bacterium]
MTLQIPLPDPSAPLRIGTRGSPLALAQAHETRDRLSAAYGLDPLAFSIVVIKTTGDRVLDRPLSEIGGKGLFTKEIEDAMLQHDIDIAVHSTKDMPVEQPAGLIIDCYLPREDVRDAFVTLSGDRLSDLPNGSVVGTSSLRRRAQLRARRPDLEIVEFRGNVQTRMAKLRDGIASATFLAMAGLNRLGLDDVPRVALSTEDMLPAVAQGAICIERRIDDPISAAMLATIHDTATGQRLDAERAFLAGLDGSCQTPIAGLAEIHGPDIRLRGEILRPDGSEVISDDRTAPLVEAAALGAAMASDLRARAGEGFFDMLG